LRLLHPRYQTKEKRGWTVKKKKVILMWLGWWVARRSCLLAEKDGDGPGHRHDHLLLYSSVY
jgi:hypothetical protein